MQLNMSEKRFSRLVGDKASAIPSVVNVAEFFIARAPEVVKLYNSIKIKDRFIPNHMRRRIRSYKPWHIRPKKRKNQSGGEKTLSRRNQRLHRLHLVEEEGCKTRLPCTHIWHAKRFRMENMWGMRLPVRVNGKGPRSIRRISKQGCVVHDRSYMDYWRFVVESWTDLVLKLRSIGFDGNLEHSKIVSGDFFATGFIKADCLVLSPYQLLRISDSAVEVWTHPAGRLEVAPLMHTLGVTLETKRIRFELLGARAIEILRKALGRLDLVVEKIPGKAQRIDGAVLNCRAAGRMLDVLIQDADQAHYVLRSFCRAGASPIGAHDRHALLSYLLVPDFPYDFPSSKAGARHAAIEAKRVLEIDQKRPRHAKMNSESVESPFFSDWGLLGCSSRLPGEDELEAVSVVASRGVIHNNAHIYIDQILVGFVTTTCGKEDLRAVGFTKVRGFASSRGVPVELNNPGSTERLKAFMYPCELRSTDSNMIDYRVS